MAHSPFGKLNCSRKKTTLKQKIHVEVGSSVCRQNEEFAEEMTEEEARRRWDAVVASLER